MNKEIIFKQLSEKYNLSNQAIEELANALQRGNFTMAQFNHPELGGMGQWMQGGMTMVGDMFNNQLKFTIENICVELINIIQNNPSVFSPPQSPMNMQNNNWWGEDLGNPASSGGQNDTKYAYFPDKNRLAVSLNNVVKIYDTTGYQITGFSQQQSNFSSMHFNTIQGLVYLKDLREVN